MRPRKPIFAVANSLAASGAYCISSAASEFYVTPGGEVGSIGIVAAHQDVSKGLERAGIETTLVKAGKYKTEGSPLGPLGADAQRHMQSRVNEYFRMLVGAIAKHRGVPESAVRHGYNQGRLLDALAAGRVPIAAFPKAPLRESRADGSNCPAARPFRTRFPCRRGL